MRMLASTEILYGSPANAFRRPAFAGRRKPDARTPRFGQTNRDSLFGRAGAVNSFADMMDFFADEFARHS
jgi:hypothetical protein